MATITLNQFATVRTTVTLPVELVERSQRLIEKGAVPSRNALIVAALEYFLTELEREEIDQAFASMADDTAYLELSEQVAEEFAVSDWEALSITEEAIS
ncbi:MAG: ribbon-helix-helix domain-containing protein [Chloroflexi bacterium]|nr:ribbon-helix-helix domain-containing protein [Chloroflexota bacterium]MCI0643492.1 ribbon-helix-helix domain-containing protein [Chloroflexota bacterium]MCI0728270.1 ribbon-helix-helix domain-containing protein [Chloroflexota bacterium]